MKETNSQILIPGCNWEYCFLLWHLRARGLPKNLKGWKCPCGIKVTNISPMGDLIKVEIEDLLESNDGSNKA